MAFCTGALGSQPVLERYSIQMICYLFIFSENEQQIDRLPFVNDTGFKFECR